MKPAGTFRPHAVPLDRFRSVADAMNARLCLTDPWPLEVQAGALAARLNISRQQNPHAVGTAAGASWDAGWLNASLAARYEGGS